MKITAIKPYPVWVGTRNQLVVKVETDEGIYGWGESGLSGREKAVVGALEHYREFVIGQNPMQISRIWQEMYRSQYFEGGRVLQAAISALDIALHDIKGKALGVPVYELLGGKFRDKIRVYADCQVEPNMEFDEIKRVVEQVAERGFTALKIDVDIGVYTGDYRRAGGVQKDRFNYTADPWEHERMVKLVEMVIEAAGPNIDVAADVHTRLDVPSAVRLARDLEQFPLLWLEEPVPPENVDAMREVKQSTTTPICAGENLYLRHGFRELITKQAVDIIMPDIPKCGGLSECRKIANLAEIYYIPFAPHNVSSPIGTMASAHVCATIPNFLVLEFHWLHRNYWSTITTSKEDIIKDGYITLTDQPGIGLELDEEVARAHQFPGTTWFEEA